MKRISEAISNVFWYASKDSKRTRESNSSEFVPDAYEAILRQKRNGLLQSGDMRTAAKHSWAGLKKQFERK